MKTALLQFLAALIGFGMLAYGEIKHYAETHPEVLSTLQIEAKRAVPLKFYNVQIALDPNTGKKWYFYGDGYWYDRMPELK